MPQDVVLFHGDIRENILLGASDVSDADLLQAIRGACLEDTLAQLPQGLGSEVGERGERLSGASARPSPSLGRWFAGRVCCCSTNPAA